jgi:hypothetical protein
MPQIDLACRLYVRSDVVRGSAYSNGQRAEIGSLEFCGPPSVRSRHSFLQEIRRIAARNARREILGSGRLHSQSVHFLFAKEMSRIMASFSLCGLRSE